MTGAQLALPLALLAALLVLAALLHAWGRWEHRHAARIAELHARAGTEQQDEDALEAGADREGWSQPVEGDAA